MPKAAGFEWMKRKNGDIVITQNGRVATTLRRGRAMKFVADVGAGDEQEVMARVTGNYKRGNERSGR